MPTASTTVWIAIPEPSTVFGSGRQYKWPAHSGVPVLKITGVDSLLGPWISEIPVQGPE